MTFLTVLFYHTPEMMQLQAIKAAGLLSSPSPQVTGTSNPMEIQVRELMCATTLLGVIHWHLAELRYPHNKGDQNPRLGMICPSVQSSYPFYFWKRICISKSHHC